MSPWLSQTKRGGKQKISSKVTAGPRATGGLACLATISQSRQRLSWCFGELLVIGDYSVRNDWFWFWRHSVVAPGSLPTPVSFLLPFSNFLIWKNTSVIWWTCPCGFDSVSCQMANINGQNEVWHVLNHQVHKPHFPTKGQNKDFPEHGSTLHECVLALEIVLTRSTLWDAVTIV